MLGAGLWGSLFCLLGYFFWQSLNKVEAYIGAGAAAFSGLVVVVPRHLVRASATAATRSSAPRSSSGSSAARRGTGSAAR